MTDLRWARLLLLAATVLTISGAATWALTTSWRSSTDESVGSALRAESASPVGDGQPSDGPDDGGSSPLLVVTVTRSENEPDGGTPLAEGEAGSDATAGTTVGPAITGTATDNITDNITDTATDNITVRVTTTHTTTHRPAATNTPTDTAADTATDTTTATTARAGVDTSPVAVAPAAGRSGRFETLPPGATLPSSRACAAAIRPTVENVPENKPYNNRRGTSVAGQTYLSRNTSIAPNHLESRIDGDFTGSTDEIIQWAACKWGFDEDHVRAQAYAESSWFAGKLGDCGEPAQPRTGGPSGCASVGLLQIRSADLPAKFHPGLWPITWESTAMNLDYGLAIKRLCFEGDELWLAHTADSGVDYRAGDEWGCAGRWFSGDWHDPGAIGYIESVRSLLRDRPWESQYVGCPNWSSNFYCSNGAASGT